MNHRRHAVRFALIITAAWALIWTAAEIFNRSTGG